MAWYKTIKKADASSDQDESGLNAFSPDSPVNRDTGQIRYFDRHSPIPFQKNNTVKLRYVGLAFPQIRGVVVKAGEDGIIVEWQSGKGRKGRKEKFTIEQAQASLDKAD